MADHDKPRASDDLDHRGVSVITLAVLGLCLAALVGTLGWLSRTGSVSQSVEVVPTSVAPATTAPPPRPTSVPEAEEAPEPPPALGLEWRSVALDDIEGFERGPHQQLVVNGDVLYISSGTAVYASHDLKSAVRLDLPTEGEIHDLAVDGETIAVVSAADFVESSQCTATGARRVHVSTDLAETWVEVELPPDDRDIPGEYFWPSDFATVAIDGGHVLVARHRLPPLRNASCILDDAAAEAASQVVATYDTAIAELFRVQAGEATATGSQISSVASAGGAIVGRSGGETVVTTNGGATWEPLENGLVADTTALFRPDGVEGLLSWTYDGGGRWHAVADTLGRRIVDIADLGGKPYALTEADDGQYVATPTVEVAWASQPVSEIVNGLGAATPIETIWSIGDQIVFSSFTRTGHILLVGAATEPGG